MKLLLNYKILIYFFLFALILSFIPPPLAPRFAEEERTRGAACLKPRIEYDQVELGAEDDLSRPSHFKSPAVPLTSAAGAMVAPPLQFNVGGHRNDYCHVWERPLPLPSTLLGGEMMEVGDTFLRGVIPLEEEAPFELGGPAVTRVLERGGRNFGDMGQGGHVASEFGVRRTDCEPGC